MTVPVKLNFNGPVPDCTPEELQDAVNNYWFAMVGLSVDIFNKHIAEWNDEYDKLGLPISTDDHSDYDKWVAKKMIPVGEAINVLVLKNPLISEYFYEDDARLSVKLCNGTTISYEIDWPAAGIKEEIA